MAGRVGEPVVVLPEGAAAARRPRTAVVLAAGRSERMQQLTRGGSKLLLHLGGISLIERTVRLAAREVDRVVVVVGHDEGRVAVAAMRAAPHQVQIVHAESWRLGNGASLRAAEPLCLEDALILVVVGDHVLSERALRALLDAEGPAALVQPEAPEAILEEATRVVVDDGHAIGFGKDKPSHTVDCGAFVLPPEIFHHQREAAADGDHDLAGAISRLALTSRVKAVPLPTSAWWRDVDTPADLQWTKGQLRRSLTKVTDGPVSRWLNRPLSTRVSMLLARLRLSPDLVTFLVCALGLLAAASLAAGQQVLGAVLAQATSVLDGVDGELARLRIRARPQGALLDGVLDRFVDTAIVVGLGLWALTQGRVPPAALLVLVGAATAGSLLSMAIKDRARALGLPDLPEQRLGLLLGGRDGRLLVVAVFALVGRPELALIAVMVTAGATAAVRVSLLMRRRS